MYLSIRRGSLSLEEPDNVRTFAVRCQEPLTDDDIRAVLRLAEAGELVDDGRHVMVDVAAVRHLAAGRVHADWAGEFEAMVQFAARQGWVSPDGGHVRAHVVR